MENVFWNFAFKHLLPGDFIVLGIVLIGTWFFYRNFGRNIMKTISEKIDSKVAIKDCIQTRSDCQMLLAEKRQGMKDNLDLRFQAVEEKIDLILSNQQHFIDMITSYFKKNGL